MKTPSIPILCQAIQLLYVLVVGHFFQEFGQLLQSPGKSLKALLQVTLQLGHVCYLGADVQDLKGFVQIRA